MEKKKRRSLLIILFVVLFIAYIIIAVRPLGTEYQITPSWRLDVTNPTVSEIEENSEVLPFKFSHSMGYFTEDGKVSAFISFPYKASISQKFYTYYNQNNTQSPCYTPNGTLSFMINVAGFPFIQDDRLYVFTPGGAGIVQVDSTGGPIWEYTGTSPITAFNSSSNGVAIGYADGAIYELNNLGHVIRSFSPGGSDYPAIHGIALSKDSSLIATVCGQHKERFVLARNQGVNAKIIFHEFIDTISPYQMLVAFYNNDKNVVYNSGSLLGFVDVRRAKSAHLSITGHAINVQEAGNCVYVLTKEDSDKVVDSSSPRYKYTVYIVERLATKIGEFSFYANEAFIKTHNDKLYIGKDSIISQMTLQKI